MFAATKLDANSPAGKHLSEAIKNLPDSDRLLDAIEKEVKKFLLTPKPIVDKNYDDTYKVPPDFTEEEAEKHINKAREILNQTLSSRSATQSNPFDPFSPERFDWEKAAKSDTKDEMKPDVPDVKVLINLRELAVLLKGKNFNSSLEIEQFCAELATRGANVKEIPTVAPELWVNRGTNDITPGHFIHRVYGVNRHNNFHTGTVQKLDKSLSIAFDRWKAKGFPDAPEGFYLPTKREVMQNEETPTLQVLEARRYAERIRQRASRARTTDRS